MSCGVVWCGVVWCGVVWCGVPKALLPEGNGRDVYPRVQVNGLGCVYCARAVCTCVGPGGERGKTWSGRPWRPRLFQELPLHPFSFRLLVQA